MTGPRGMTLVEVLAAVVLLAVVVGAAVPLLAGARASLEAGPRAEEIARLARTADGVMRRRDVSGAEAARLAHSGDEMTVSEPGGPAGVRAVRSEGAAAGVWLIFRDADAAVARWRPLAPEDGNIEDRAVPGGEGVR